MSLALREAKFFTGIDWAAEIHAVCVMDAAGTIVAQFTIAHSADGIATLIRRLARFADPAEMQVAIERPNGRLVDFLLEAGHPVVPVKPNAIKAWREGEVLSGAKSDAGDAAVIAEYLRLRQHKLTVAVPYSGQTTALRTVVRTRGDLVQTRVATASQLTALLEDCWPGAAVIFADIESPIALAFLARYPTPESARHLGEKRMAAFCSSHGYTGRRTAAELLERLRSAPAGTLEQARTVALRDAVLALVTVLTALGAAVKSVAAKVGSDQRRPDARRVGRLPASLRAPRLGRCPRRSHPGHQAIRQAPLRRVPLGLQQAVPAGDHSLRRQQPTRQPLGRADLSRRHRRRQGPPARHPHPGPRLDPHHLPLLDRRRPLRPSPARSRGRARQAIHQANRGLRLTQGVFFARSRLGGAACDTTSRAKQAASALTDDGRHAAM